MRPCAVPPDESQRTNTPSDTSSAVAFRDFAPAFSSRTDASTSSIRFRASARACSFFDDRTRPAFDPLTADAASSSTVSGFMPSRVGPTSNRSMDRSSRTDP